MAFLATILMTALSGIIIPAVVLVSTFAFVAILSSASILILPAPPEIPGEIRETFDIISN